MCFPSPPLLKSREEREFKQVRHIEEITWMMYYARMRQLAQVYEFVAGTLSVFECTFTANKSLKILKQYVHFTQQGEVSRGDSSGTASTRIPGSTSIPPSDIPIF